MDKGFFAVGIEEWRQACSLGLNEACSFLVLACGTGRDNCTTAWSANAVQTYAGISWVRAKPAIERLSRANLVENTGSTQKPRYKLKIGDERIWLPKSIVMPVAGEIPALHRIRQAQDEMLLRLFVELYYAQNLAADGGLSRQVYYRKFERKIFAESGQFIFLGFDDPTGYVSWSTDVTKVHYVNVTADEKKSGKNPGHLFFKRIQSLFDMGLLEYSVCLFESDRDDAEILFPVDGPSDIEREIKLASSALAEALLQDWQVNNCPHEHLIPVFRHQDKAQAYGIYRLRHRPHTALTSAWWGMLNDRVKVAKASMLSGR